MPSKIRTPRASSRSRSPKASRAGCTVAVCGTNTPPRNTGDAQIACAPAASTARTAAPSTASALTPSCAGAVETTSSPALRYQASTPSASHQAPIASTVACAAATQARAGASPRSARSDGRLRSRLETKPPLRPLGPCPQRAASTMTTRASGAASSTCQAVHIPT